MRSMFRLMSMAAIVALVGCEPEGVKPPERMLLGNEDADQVYYGMHQISTDKGVRKSLVDADTAYLYTKSQRADLRGFRVRFFDEHGKETGSLTARQAIYQLADGSLDARGDVVVKSAEGDELRTEHLVYNGTTLKFTSDTNFVLITHEGTTTSKITGKGFESDRELKSKTFKGRPRFEQIGPGVELENGTDGQEGGQQDGQQDGRQ